MVLRLERWQEDGDLHFATFSCWRRLPYLGVGAARDLFEEALERMRIDRRLSVFGYAVMPEHVHLLLGEPVKDRLSVALQSLKLTVTRRSRRERFWQARYYDFNVTTDKKRIEKLKYMHWNPVKRGLVEKPEDWPWSSCRFYQTRVKGRVTIDDSWLVV